MIKKETHKRAILKSISWRIMATLTTFIIVYFLTGDIVLATSAGGIEVVVKIIAYYLHELAWNNTKSASKPVFMAKHKHAQKVIDD